MFAKLLETRLRRLFVQQNSCWLISFWSTNQLQLYFHLGVVFKKISWGEAVETQAAMAFGGPAKCQISFLKGHKSQRVPEPDRLLKCNTAFSIAQHFHAYMQQPCLLEKDKQTFSKNMGVIAPFFGWWFALSRSDGLIFLASTSGWLQLVLGSFLGVGLTLVWPSTGLCWHLFW